MDSSSRIPTLRTVSLVTLIMVRFLVLSVYFTRQGALIPRLTKGFTAMNALHVDMARHQIHLEMLAVAAAADHQFGGDVLAAHAADDVDGFGFHGISKRARS